MRQNSRPAVGVYWSDIRVYHDGGIHELTPMYTEGTLVRETKEYFLIKDPETIAYGKKIYNHPQKKPKYYFLPRALVKSVTHYGQEK